MVVTSRNKLLILVYSSDLLQTLTPSFDPVFSHGLNGHQQGWRRHLQAQRLSCLGMVEDMQVLRAAISIVLQLPFGPSLFACNTCSHFLSCYALLHPYSTDNFCGCSGVRTQNFRQQQGQRHTDLSLWHYMTKPIAHSIQQHYTSFPEYPASYIHVT